MQGGLQHPKTPHINPPETQVAMLNTILLCIYCSCFSNFSPILLFLNLICFTLLFTISGSSVGKVRQNNKDMKKKFAELKKATCSALVKQGILVDELVTKITDLPTGRTISAVGPSYAQLSSLHIQYLLSTLDVIHVTFWTRLSLRSLVSRPHPGYETTPSVSF